MGQPLPRARAARGGPGAAVVRSLNLRQMIEMMTKLPFLRHRRLTSRRPGPPRPHAATTREPAMWECNANPTKRFN